VSADVETAVDAMRAEYETQLDARYAAARGFVDAIIYPEETREVLATALRTAACNPGPHIGAFVLPGGLTGEGARWSGRDSSS
jgi:hypothetical protein